MALARDYNEWHLERLCEEHTEKSAYIADYLTACLEEGEDVFLLGLKKVAQALGGISKLAEQTNLPRTHLYIMLSEDGNPTLASVSTVLHSFGVQLQCVPAEQN